jgi:adenylate cyclase
MIYRFADCILDTERRELQRSGQVVPLEPQVFDLLVLFARRPDEVVARGDLIDAVWEGRFIADATIDSRIATARRAIGDSGSMQALIRTLPRRGFRFVGTVSVEGPTERFPARALPDRPSIAVLPFTNFGSDPRQEYFSDGITEDIITELSRYSELMVIARFSSFRYKRQALDIRQVGRELGARYVLEGSVRREGSRIRISAQLIEAQTGTYLWGERYDRQIKDVFAVQEAVAREVAAILAVQVNRAEAERILNKPPATWEAYDYYMRAAAVYDGFMASRIVEELYKARRFVEHALSIDPAYARAYAKLSQTYTVAYMEPSDGEYMTRAVLDRAYSLATKAVELGPNLPFAHATLGWALLWKGEHDAAISATEHALNLNPGFSYPNRALILTYAGQADKALEVIAATKRLDPFHPPSLFGFLGHAYYVLGRYAEALPSLRECAYRAPDFRAAHAWLAATYGQLGQLEKARMHVAEILRIEPGCSLGRVRRLIVYRNAGDADHLLDGLRKAGLPA